MVKYTRAQTVILGYVFLAAIVITTVAAAYLYIIPMLNKSSLESKIPIYENSLVQFSTIVKDLVDNTNNIDVTLTLPDTYITVSRNSIAISAKNSKGTNEVIDTFIIPKYYPKCESNNVVSYNGYLDLCGLNAIEVVTNSTHIRINDNTVNNVVIIPIGQDYINAIIGFRIFDIKDEQNKVVFKEKGSIGIHKFEDSPVFIEKVVDKDTIKYIITPRPIFYINNRECKILEFVPYAKSGKNVDKNVIIEFQFLGSEEKENIVSTTCDKVIVYRYRVVLK